MAMSFGSHLRRTYRSGSAVMGLKSPPSPKKEVLEKSNLLKK